MDLHHSLVLMDPICIWAWKLDCKDAPEAMPDFASSGKGKHLESGGKVPCNIVLLSHEFKLLKFK